MVKRKVRSKRNFPPVEQAHSPIVEVQPAGGVPGAAEDPPQPTYDPLLSPDETAARLRCTVASLAVWRSKRRYNLPFVRIGNRIFYRQSTLERFIRERETDETGHQDQTWRERRKERLAAEQQTVR